MAGSSSALDRPMDKFLDYALWLTARDLQNDWLPVVRAGKPSFGGNVTHLVFALQAVGSTDVVGYEALEKLCRIYWRPIYSFAQRQGLGPEEAKDITQGFFAQLLERRSFSAVRKEKGRLRSFLLGALKYFLADEHRRASAIKRGKGQRLIQLEELHRHPVVIPVDQAGTPSYNELVLVVRGHDARTRGQATGSRSRRPRPTRTSRI